MPVGAVVAIAAGLGIIWLMMLATIFAATRVQDGHD